MSTTITLEPDHQRRFWYRHPRRSGGSATKTIIALNLLLFVWMVVRGLLAGRGLKALVNPDLDLLIYAGAQNWGLVLDYGQWWRCLSYAFTHGGMLHLAFNMVALYQVGLLLERETGRTPLLVVYVTSALSATLAGYLWHPEVSVVGASGALFGLIGFAVVFYRRLGDPESQYKSRFMLQWAIFAFLFGFAVHADNAGHLGGALGGAAVALLLHPALLVRQPPPRFLQGLAALLTLVTLMSLMMLVIFWVRLETGL